MNIQEFRAYCFTKPACTEDFPFDENSLCLRVGGKIFCIASIDAIPLKVNLKCDPEKAIELREKFDAIIPGFHMNKKHWNTVILDGSLDLDLIKSLIDESYDLIFASLKKSERESIIKTDKN